MPVSSPPAHRNPGFTLIELLVTLCIIGILALSAYPLYYTTVLKAKRAEAKTALLRAMQQQERYYSQHNRYRAYQGPSAGDDRGLIWFSADSAAASAYQISAAACRGQSLEQCVELSATPGGALVDSSYQDPLCGTLSLNSRGEKTAAGAPLEQAPDVCR